MIVIERSCKNINRLYFALLHSTFIISTSLVVSLFYYIEKFLDPASVGLRLLSHLSLFILFMVNLLYWMFLDSKKKRDGFFFKHPLLKLSSGLIGLASFISLLYGLVIIYTNH